MLSGIRSSWAHDVLHAPEDLAAIIVAGQSQCRLPSRVVVLTHGKRPGILGPADRQLYARQQHALSRIGDAKQALLEAAKVGRTIDTASAGQIISNLNLGRTFAHTAEQEEQNGAMTPKDMRAAFKRYVAPKKLLIIRAGDFKK